MQDRPFQEREAHSLKAQFLGTELNETEIAPIEGMSTSGAYAGFGLWTSNHQSEPILMRGILAHISIGVL